MKKVQIKLEYKDKTYLSEMIQMTDEDFEGLQILVETICKGKTHNFSMRNLGNIYSFPAKVLSESIITIITIS